MLTSFYIKEKATFFLSSIIEELSDLLIFFIKQQETYMITCTSVRIDCQWYTMLIFNDS